jgi:hypothetical protein
MKDEQIGRAVELIFALSPSPRFPNHQAHWVEPTQ